MISRPGAALVAALLLGTVLMAPSPSEAACTTSAECTGGNTCVVVLDLWLLKWKECRITLCNVDDECRAGTLCLLGTCQVGCRGDNDCPAQATCNNAQCTNPSPKPGAGTIAGEGRKCMPADGSRPAGWATDSRGKPLGACPQGTSCSSRGYCQRLEP